MSRDPLRELRSWQERLERMTLYHAEPWTPPIDVYETPDRYVVAAELPGLSRDEIDLAIEDSRLTIRAQRVDRGASAGEALHYHQVERGHGAFARTFDFSQKIDMDGVSADLSNGVLTVTLLKVPPPPARRIEVR